MNATVQIDESQVRAELRSIELEHVVPDASTPSAAPGVGSAPGSVDHQAPPAPEPPNWTMAAAGVVAIFDRVVAPNWQLEPGEKDAMREATAQVLVAFFPDALDPRVQACFALAGTMYLIAQARHDPATGKVRAMHVKKPEPPVEADGAATRAAA